MFYNSALNESTFLYKIVDACIMCLCSCMDNFLLYRKRCTDIRILPVYRILAGGVIVVKYTGHLSEGMRTFCCTVID